MEIDIDHSYLIDTLVDLVQIDSSNPSLNPEAPGEAEIAAYLAGKMAALGLDVTVEEVRPGRPNVTGVLHGIGNGRSLLLNGHSDTVGVSGMAEPFSARISENRLYGRGSYDMKGSLAAYLAVIKALNDAGVKLGGDLAIAAVVDEEHASLGTEHLCKKVKCDGAILAEPTDMAICRAHRGFIWYEVETIGQAAHGSRYQEGIDANLHMGRFLAELDCLAQDLVNRPPHPLMGPPSLNASILQGGQELSTYSDRCVLKMERRTIAGETEEVCREELQAILDGLGKVDPAFNASLRPFFQRHPYEIGPDAPIVFAVEKAATQVLGASPRHIGQTFWTDAALMGQAGMETVLFGPSGKGLHCAEEWVSLESLFHLASILSLSAVDYCIKV
jgi:acetylornithine deacetylase